MNSKTLGLVIAAAAASLSVTAQAALPSAVDGKELPTLAPMIKQASPAVVNIAVRGSVAVQRHNPFLNDPFFQRFFNSPQLPQRRRTMSAGSGVIVDAKNGYILTNHHVVENADEIMITLLDDRNIEARVVGSDPGSDVAVLQVDANNLAQIPLANSDAIEVGDFVVAIGNPFGFAHTVTSGIVSGLGRYGLSDSAYENFIQTDAAINPGNSGGALINLRGELLGINTAIASVTGGNLGIGFAIPINVARDVMDQILEFGEVRRGLLGVNILPVNSVVAENMGLDLDHGALITEIMPGSAADKAGLEVADVVVAVNGEKVKNHTELRNAIGLMKEGDEVELDVVRDGANKTFTARLGSRAQPVRVAAVDLHPALEGAEFSEMDATMVATVGSHGVMVSMVKNGSPAAAAGLEPGDVITRVNRTKVADLDTFRDAAAGDGPLMLTVLRDGALRLLPIG